MAQQEQIIINMSQVQNQDEKQHLFKLFPKKQFLAFSLLQLVFGFFAILFQVCKLDDHCNRCPAKLYTFFRLLESLIKSTTGTDGMVLSFLVGVYGQDLCFVFLEVLV